MPMGTDQMTEELDMDELNEELKAYSIYFEKMKKVNEERKSTSLVLKDRLGKENKTNFKKDFADSDTKGTIDVEKELMYADEQTDVGDNPHKFSEDIEKEALKKTKGEALKDEGDSANLDGDEIPKRNATDDEQHDVDMVRLNLGDYVYDNKPSERFEKRMEQDMGDELYKKRQEKMEFRSKAPMYNKDSQPIDDGDKVEQFDKDKKGWNDGGINESMITGRYRNALNKSKIIDFTLNEVFEIKENDGYFKLDFTGLGNSLVGRSKDNKVLVNEGVVDVINDHDFYTDSNRVFAIRKSKDINESVNKETKVLNEEVEKIRRLSGYKPQGFVSTKKVKKNRGF